MRHGPDRRTHRRIDRRARRRDAGGGRQPAVGRGRGGGWASAGVAAGIGVATVDFGFAAIAAGAGGVAGPTLAGYEGEIRSRAR